jgi:hypothetical protein
LAGIQAAKSVSECGALCAADESCAGFEYGVQYGGAGLPTVNFQPNDCMLSDVSDTTGCDGEQYNLDFYEIHRAPKAPADAVCLAPADAGAALGTWTQLSSTQDCGWGANGGVVSQHAVIPDADTCQTMCSQSTDCRYYTFYLATQFCSLFRTCALTDHESEPRTFQKSVVKWVKLMSNGAIPGSSHNGGERHFVEEGAYARLAVVRKSGYVSCSCQASGHSHCSSNDCIGTDRSSCCTHNGITWNTCQYADQAHGYVATESVPFEMAVNAEQIVWQPTPADGAQTAEGACTLPSQSPSNAIFCDLDLDTKVTDIVSLSWNEVRLRLRAIDLH